jgi:hypothetical protein
MKISSAVRNIFGLAILFLYSSASAATLTVTTTVDTTAGGSLRAAIAAANPGDEITFASPLFDSPQTITLTPDGMGGLGGLLINKSLTITGPGAHLLTIGRPPPADHLDHNRMQIFNIGSNITVTLSGMTISGGLSASAGGGIQTSSINCHTTLIGCHVTGNYALSSGGGIRNNNPMTIIDSTISNNGTDGTGGGIYNTGALTITNSTISGNTGVGIYHFSGNVLITSSTITDNGVSATNAQGNGVYTIATLTVTVGNSIIAGNRNSDTAPDIVAPSPGGSFPEFASNGYNLIGNVGTVTAFNQTGDQTGVTNPMLAVLNFNDGSTPTHALLAGSPAIDKGNSFGSDTDQRGFMRPRDDTSIDPASGGDNSDIGAYELQALTLTSAVSRKTHGGIDHDIPLNLSGTPTVECRNSGGNHQLVFAFANDIAAGNISLTTQTGGSISGSPSFSGNTITVNLTGVADKQTITVTLDNVTDNFAQVLPTTEVKMSILGGDTNGNGAVTGTDISQTKSQVGHPVTDANCREDVVVSGGINSSDVGQVKLKSGNGLPPIMQGSDRSRKTRPTK